MHNNLEAKSVLLGKFVSKVNEDSCKKYMHVLYPRRSNAKSLFDLQDAYSRNMFHFIFLKLSTFSVLCVISFI